MALLTKPATSWLRAIRVVHESAGILCYLTSRVQREHQTMLPLLPARYMIEQSEPKRGGGSPKLVGPECQGTPRAERREDSDRESSAIDNPLALRHPEFTKTAEGTARTSSPRFATPLSSSRLL